MTVRQVRLWWRLNQSGRASRSVRMGRRRAPFWYADATMTTVNGRSVKRRLIESKREARGFLERQRPPEVRRILERRPH